MDKNTYSSLSSFIFKSKEEIETKLENMCAVYAEYDGVFSPYLFEEKFPYLQEFFNYLEDWREKTGRVLIEDNVLEEGYKLIINDMNRTLKKVN